jgi:hypothetical protein
MFWRSLATLVLLAMGTLTAGAQAPATTPPTTLYVFPLFADGTGPNGSYRSVVRITQTNTPSPMQCIVQQRNTASPFTGIVGYYYSADVLDAGFSPLAVSIVNLDSYLPFEILRTNGQAPMKNGYATVACPGAIQADVQVAMYDAKNNKVAEATILPGTTGQSFQFLRDTRDGTRLAFSYVNNSNAVGQFIVIARDQFNFEVDRRYEDIDSWSQVAHFVDDELKLPQGFVGTIEVVGLSGGSNFVVGLQFTGSVFTTIQPIVRSTPIGN